MAVGPQALAGMGGVASEVTAVYRRIVAARHEGSDRQVYDRWLLLGEKRNQKLRLSEVRQYGRVASATRTTSRSTASHPLSGMRAESGSWDARPWNAHAIGSLT
jgi:hypothetical protein